MDVKFPGVVLVLLVEDVLAFILSLVFTMKVLLSLVWYFSKSSSGWMFLPGSTCLGAGALLGTVPLWPPSLETSAYSLLSQACPGFLWHLLPPEHLCSRALCEDGLF